MIVRPRRLTTADKLFVAFSQALKQQPYLRLELVYFCDTDWSGQIMAHGLPGQETVVAAASGPTPYTVCAQLSQALQLRIKTQTIYV